LQQPPAQLCPLAPQAVHTLLEQVPLQQSENAWQL
jgi:hypothetical protein